MLKFKLGILSGIVIFLGVLAFSLFKSPTFIEVKAGNDDKITICHAKPADTAANGYDDIEVSTNSLINPQDNGGQHITEHDADIIPPFDYTTTDTVITKVCPNNYEDYGDPNLCRKSCTNGNDCVNGWKYKEKDEKTETVITPHHYDGKNYSDQGKAILDNGCVIPTPVCIETKSCPTTCHTDITITGDCGSITCTSNAPAEQNCPTGCGLEASTVSDGVCGVKQCSATSACPTPTPTPNCEEDESCPTPTPTVTPTPTPTVTPTPSTSTMESKLSADTLTCSNTDINVTMELKNNGVAGANIPVKFTYNNIVKTVTTNNDGKASVSFGYAKDDSVQADPEGGYSSQSVSISGPKDCPSVGGQVLGTTTVKPSGKVLGAYASTGVVEDTLMNVVGFLGVAMTTGGSLLYAKKKRS